MSFILRDYQTEALQTTYQRLKQGHRPIICAPTGSGKTVIAGQMAKDAMDQGKRVLWMTGREEIIRQAYGTFSDMCGADKVGVLCAGLAGETPWWFYPPVTIASWDTLKARWNKSDVWRIPADLVMFDEAHLSLSKKMSETIIPYYENAQTVGFTATPSRRNGKGLGSFYSRIIQVRRMQDIIDDGFLAAPEYWSAAQTDRLRALVSEIKTVNGDFEKRGLSEAASDNVLLGDVLDNWLRIARDRHSICFAVDIAHAQALMERFQGVGISAAAIHSKMTHSTRALISEQFRRQDIQVLVNVGIATYGYDVPEINCVVVARPTRSIVLWHQMVGRGLRPKPNGDYCKVIDHGDNVRRLGCVEDEIRWRLAEGKAAAVNTTRQGDKSRNKSPEAPPTECAECHYLFSRSRVCPKCGWEKPVRSRDVDTLDADLVKVRKAQSSQLYLDDPGYRLRWYRMALGWCDKYQKKRGMARYRYIDKFKDEPPNDWRALEPDERVSAYMKASLIRYAKRMRKQARMVR